MICPTILDFFLTALSPAAWNFRNRPRISLWSALSMTMASDDMLLLPARLGPGGGYPPAQPANPGGRPAPEFSAVAGMRTPNAGACSSRPAAREDQPPPG